MFAVGLHNIYVMQQKTTDSQIASKSMYRDVISRIKESLNIDDISTWVFGGKSDLNMCFVGDDCPKEYRNQVLEIIKDVESEYKNQFLR